MKRILAALLALALVLSAAAALGEGLTKTGVYYASNSKSQVCDIHVPEGEGPFPVIVLVHGGGFAFGDAGMPIIRPVIDAALARGYAVVSVDYRKSSEAVFPAALADVKAAVRFVRRTAGRYGFDAERIAIWGESAGAYLALMTALTPEVGALSGDVSVNAELSSAVRALVSFYAPVEFYTMDEEYAALGVSGSTFSGPDSFESRFLGTPVGENRELTYTTCWETYVGELPEGFALNAWIQAGDADTKVPCTQSVHFAQRLEEVIGAQNVRFGLLPGADHEDAAFYTEENLSAVLDFLDDALSR